MIVYILVSFLAAVIIHLIYRKQTGFQFKNKHVVVVGGSQGIGKELVYLLLKEQCSTVSVISRNLANLRSVIDDCPNEVSNANTHLKNKSLKSKIEIYSCDITQKDKVKETIKSIIDKGTPIDCLINCAGFAIPGYFIEQDEEIFERTMKLDYFGSVYTTKEIVPHMIENGTGGHIVFVSSTCGLVGVPGYSTYCPTKFAIKGFAETLRSELKPYNITFSVVYPPDTDTPGYKQENLTKPEETVAISGGGKAVPAIEVAKCIVSGVKNGDYHIAYDLATKLCAILSPGLTPFYYSFFDILLAPVCRLVGVIAMHQNDSEVMKAWKKRQIK
ncbi:hypothetical protein DICPUDRAFT_43831 [Dictyostelium purpureum]|uniref:3-dehydrosphinganine reductase n=1 Tax=Dictyostelium purpureum TaxID=5786 RepID=F1A4W5_DICPU|nr:uncharacterized protein DICPUDRAFT_43831 [Dictyostelium purpureum]EGC28764.1 hypothetical protein DICPUDRAFT_43831 [Dictyostelium purpureum]|eukprot:XP_003294711.1 hypothetical protein DICPUDRAFT_43831 [Dictyostelium purpureum]